jgi:hypothetical protein
MFMSNKTKIEKFETSTADKIKEVSSHIHMGLSMLAMAATVVTLEGVAHREKAHAMAVVQSPSVIPAPYENMETQKREREETHSRHASYRASQRTPSQAGSL